MAHRRNRHLLARRLRRSRFTVVGAIVLGYYFTYWAGVGRRLRRHARNNQWQPANRRLPSGDNDSRLKFYHSCQQQQVRTKTALILHCS